MDARVLLPSLRAATCLAALALLLAGGAPGVLRALEVRVESPSVTFDREANRYTYREARLTIGSLVLFADRVEVLVDRRIIRAEGFLRLRNGSLLGDARRIEIDAETGQGTLEDVNLFDTASGYYLDAQKLRVQKDGILVAEQCRLTSCPPGVSGWDLSAGRMAFYGDYAIAHSVVLHTGPVPVAAVPLLGWPTNSQRTSGVLAPRLSHETSSIDRLSLGTRLQVPVFLNLGLEQDATLTPEWIARRGPAMGLQYRYAFLPGQYGQLDAWGVREWHARIPEKERVPRDTEVPDALTTDRWRVDFGHNQPLTDAGRLVMAYAHSSDGQVRREYDGETVNRPYRSGQVGLSWQSGLGDLAATYLQDADYTLESVYARGEDFTDLGAKPQLLPRLTYRTAVRPWDALPLSAGLYATTTRFVATDAVSGRLRTASPSLTLPVPLGGAFELRPSITRHFVSYTELKQGDPEATDLPPPQVSFFQDESEVELRTTLARTYGGPEDTRVLKHRLTPRLIYRTLQDVPQPLTGEVLPARPAMRLLELRLDSDLLEGRRKPGQALPTEAKELAWLNIRQRYNLLLRDETLTVDGPPLPDPAETEPGEPLLPAIIEGGVNGPGYRLSLELHYHHQLARVTESTVGLSGRTSAHALLGIAYRYNEFSYFTPAGDRVPAENTFNLQAQVPLGDNVSLGGRGRLNMQDGTPPLDRRFDQAEAYVDLHPLCYQVRLSYTELVDTTVENKETVYFVERRVLFTFRLSGFGGGAPPQAFTLWQQEQR